ncbi:ankyrin [Ophiobolus disseminans]|uniref:Ankyrin n=1 Tax=Ophiobolus disseminans TaxID=1469910 RepID=A0A6A7A948_9PLEO|nr:ankyrin [Ophiobolus disseminans]
MERRITLQELIQRAGVTQNVARQPCLPAPMETAIIASEEDHMQARTLLLNRRAKNPEHKDVLKRIFRSSKDKKDSQEAAQYTQEELDATLLAVFRGPTTNPGLTQAFLDLGAKVNFIEAPEKKRRPSNQSNAGLRRRSTVLQQAATLRRPTCVSLLAGAGADQTTLDEGLKAALAANDQECVQELLRHGADINNSPNTLANAVRSNDQNFVRTLLRAPKAIQPKIVSSCLPAAVQQGSDTIAALLIAYGADPNFDSSSALNMAIGMQDYKMAATVVAGPVPLTQATLQRLLDTTMRLPTVEAQLQFIQLLFCCGLNPNSIGLSDFLVCRTKKDDTAGVLMMLSYGVSTATNDAECLRVAISRSNWRLAEAILQTSITPPQASKALALLPSNTPLPDRLRVIHLLVQNGATGPPLEYWLTRAVEDGDRQLMDLLLSAGAPIASSDNNPVFAAVARKDTRSLQLLLNTRPPPEVLAKAFSLLRTGYSTSERLSTSHLLLEFGAHGPEVDQALVDAVADTSTSRDLALITELVRRKASVDYANGKVLQLAVSQVDLSLLRLLCNSKPTSSAASAALPLAFDSHGNRHSRTFDIINLLLPYEIEEQPAMQTLQIAINGGPDNIDIIKQLIATNIRLLSPAFEYTIAIENPQKKTAILDVLLKMGVGQEALDKALAAESRHAVSNKDTTSTRMLVGKGASPAIDAALRVTLSQFSDSHHTETMINILLHYSANVNTADGTCFVFAAQKHGHILETLMLHKPEFGIIIPALLTSRLEDDVVIASIKSCFAHGCSPEELEMGSPRSSKTPVLIVAIQNYPRSKALVAVLLENGCNPDASIQDVVDPIVGEEVVSALVWALNQPQKRISDSVIAALLDAGASVDKASSASEIAPIAMAAREGRSSDTIHALLKRGADPSARDHSNRSALFYASSISNFSTVQALAPHALKNDGSLHEAARCIQLDAATELIKQGHNPNFPARNEKSAIILALDNAYSALEITESLLETEIWEDLNDESHLYGGSTGLWYSPIKYVELVPSPSRAAHKQDLIDLLSDKGCTPRFFSETAVQPPGAISIPQPIKRLVDRQKEHELAIRHDQERHEHARTLEENSHRDALRRRKEQQDHELAAQSHQHQHVQSLEQTTHEVTIRRVRDAERMKRGEKVAWHNLIMEQEHDASARRQTMKDREAAGEVRQIEQRKSELEHRAGVERRMLKDKEDVYERNVKRQTEVMKRADESAALHARLRQDRPAIEGAPQWGSVD